MQKPFTWETIVYETGLYRDLDFVGKHGNKRSDKQTSEDVKENTAAEGLQQNHVCCIMQDQQRSKKGTTAAGFYFEVGSSAPSPLIQKNPRYESHEARIKSCCQTIMDDESILFVVDPFNHEVLKLTKKLPIGDDSSTLTAEHKVHRRETFVNHLIGNPSGIAVDGVGTVFVADAMRHCVTVYDAAGQFRREFGRCGTERGRLFVPRHICYDGVVDLLFVVEQGNCRVSAFSRDGTFRFWCGGSKTKDQGEGSLKNPIGVCVDSGRGYLFVADPVSHRINIYSTKDGEYLSCIEGCKHHKLIALSFDPATDFLWFSVSGTDAVYGCDTRDALAARSAALV